MWTLKRMPTGPQKRERNWENYMCLCICSNAFNIIFQNEESHSLLNVHDFCFDYGKYDQGKNDYGSTPDTQL